jgi:hypothetical protein
MRLNICLYVSQESRLLYPLTFDPVDQNGLNSVLESTCLSRATVLASSNPNVPQEDVERENSPEYIFMGCEDGGIFVFRATTHVLSPSGLVSSPDSPKRRPYSPSISSISRRSSATLPMPSNIVARHARAVSNLTRERVEAPMNLVDYDEEGEEAKLRALLNNSSSTRDKMSTDPIITHSDKHLDVPNMLSNVSRAHSEKSPKPSLSPRTPEIRASVYSHSSPTSPLSRSRKSSISAIDDPSFRKSNMTALGTPSFDILYHILPHQSGPGNSVTSIVFVPKTELVMVLQESG